MGELPAFIITLLLVLVAVFALLGLGYWLARDDLADDRKRVAQQRRALDAEWRALENGRRVTDVFFAARRAMQDEVRRARWRPDR